MPQLSLADLEAVGEVLKRRWQELHTRQWHGTLEAHYAHLRALPAGSPLRVDVHHEKGLTYGERVTIERPLRKPSTRIAVHVRDGETWHLPMEWLISATEDESQCTALRSAREAQAREAHQRTVDAFLKSKEGV